MKNLYGLTLDKEYVYVCSDVYTEWSDSWVECMARHYTDPQNHQMGTACMGRVIDEQLKVYGIEGMYR